MPTTQVVSVFDGITTGILAIGGGAVVLTLALAGLCTMFAWLDMHIGGFIKKVFSSVLLGGSMMAGAGGFGKWLVAQLGMNAPAAAGQVHQTVATILGPLGWL
jgi:hypothetical protein